MNDINLGNNDTNHNNRQLSFVTSRVSDPGCFDPNLDPTLEENSDPNVKKYQIRITPNSIHSQFI